MVTYDATITLTDPPATVLNGMTASVAVTVASADNVLEVPSAVVTTAGRLSTVTVEKNGKQSVQTVSVGLVGDTTTQITSGLTAGEVVVEPTATVSNSTTGTGTTGRTGTAGITGAGVFGGAGGFTGGGAFTGGGGRG